jgi:pimeloyl-ACP methyl ester carboxylesterase
VIEVREYGESGRRVVVLHGGPGAAGYVAPVARELGKHFRVLEPLQRGSGGEALSVARHVADLHEVMGTMCAGERPALVGHSWGAMLALAYAAEYPGRGRALVLVNCGTFDEEARAVFRANLEARQDDALREKLARLADEIADADRRLMKTLELLLPLYSYDMEAAEMEFGECDARVFEETWNDMLRLQAEGVYPAAFAGIGEPVLMLHGAADPHPGELVRRTLAKYLPQIEYGEWEKCGHFPWLERHVRQEFFEMLRKWLAGVIGGNPAGQGKMEG